jgi:methylenetetrahydrofolate--tRNA-(uracil-5-)-methyltransferase
MAGVEGYVESCAGGLTAALEQVFPPTTAIGALAHYVSNPSIENFQPMNINFGLMPPMDNPPKNKREKNQMLAGRALASLSVFAKGLPVRSRA